MDINIGMYSIYSNDLERVVVIGNDLWITMHTARLLSSKMSLCVFRIDADSIVTNDDCIHWTLVNPGENMQDHQSPRLIEISKGIKHIGPALDHDLDTIQIHQEYCQFTYKAVKAAWISDAILNVGNHKFYTDIVEKPKKILLDFEHGLTCDFLNTLDKILYLSFSIEEAKEQIDNMFNLPESNTPSLLIALKDMFYKYINNEQS